MDWQGKSRPVEKFDLVGTSSAVGRGIGAAIEKIGLGRQALAKAHLDHQADVYKRAMEHQNDMEFLHQLPEHARSFTRVHGVSTTVDLGQGKPPARRTTAPRKPAGKKTTAAPAVKKPTVAAIKRQNKAAASYVTPSAGKKLDPAVKAQNAAARSYMTSVPATTSKPKPVPKSTEDN